MEKRNHHGQRPGTGTTVEIRMEHYNNQAKVTELGNETEINKRKLLGTNQENKFTFDL